MYIDIPLLIRARHFKDAEYSSVFGCVLVKAAVDQFNVSNVREYCDYMLINEEKYSHKHYGFGEFQKDSKIAKVLNYSDDVVRKIILRLEIPTQLIVDASGIIYEDLIPA